MTQRLLFVFGLFLSLSALTSTSHAVDMSNRLGIGYSQQLKSVDDLAMITLNYFPNANFAISGGVGVDTERDNSRFGAFLKIRRIIFTEKQMNFYMGGQIAGTSYEARNNAGNVEDRSNFEMAALLGGEFFFAGLDSLAFFFETGIGIITGDGGSRFRTIGDHPFKAGITFYF